VGDLHTIKQEHIHITAVSHYWQLFKFGELCDCMMSICHWLACDAPQDILASRDKWRPADVPLQAVGVASLANL